MIKMFQEKIGNKAKEFVKNRKFKLIVFPLIGALGGLLYYYTIGCNSGGGCPITGNPFISAIYGSVIGLILTL